MRQFASAFLSRITASTRAAKAMNIATMVMDDPFKGKELLQYLINEGAVTITHVPDPETKMDLVYITKPKEQSGIRREPTIAVPDAGLTLNEALTLNNLNRQRYKIHRPTIDFINKFDKYFRETNVDGLVIDKVAGLIMHVENYLKRFPDGIFYQDAKMPDMRRIYCSHNAVSHQHGDAARACVDFAAEYTLKRKDRKAFEKITQDEYGVNFKNFRKILDNPELLFTDPKSLGVKGSKPVCTWRCAYAYSELQWTGKTSYILQQDQTCSGFQHGSIEFGCRTLALLTNLVGGEKQDLYTTTAELARNMIYLAEDERYMYFLTRSGGKFFVMRIGYGAASKSLARGLILADPQVDPFTYLTDKGVYISGSLEGLEHKRFNPDNIKHWQKIGNWEECCNISKAVSNAYYEALMGLSPKLQSALRMIKEANATALDKNEFLEWRLPNGDLKRNIGWDVDTKAKHVRIGLKTSTGKAVQFNYMPMMRMATESSAPPKFIHSLDGFICGELIRECALSDIPIATIHDSFGTSVEHFVQVKEMWKRAVYAHFCARPQSLFFDMMEKYEIVIPPSVWPNGWQSLDIGAAEHYMG